MRCCALNSSLGSQFLVIFSAVSSKAKTTCCLCQGFRSIFCVSGVLVGVPVWERVVLSVYRASLREILSVSLYTPFPFTFEGEI